MDPLLFSSLSLLAVGIVASALIYWFGARRLIATPRYPAALKWTVAFTLFMCIFMSAGPFLLEQGPWILIFPFGGLALSLSAIQRMVFEERSRNNDQSS